MSTKDGTPRHPDQRLEKLFEGRLWLVSKAGPSVQKKTLAWFEHHDVYTATGLDPSRIRFCRERHEKVGHCQELGITHFIDDRRDVLGHLRGHVEHLFLFGDQKRPAPNWTVPLASWPATWEWFERHMGDMGDMDRLRRA